MTDETVDVCPECASSDLMPRTGRFDREPETRWYCRDCRAGFDEADEREKHHDGGGITRGYAAQLDDLDSSAVPVGEEVSR